MASNNEEIALQQIIPNQPCRSVYQRSQTGREIKTYLAVLSSNLLALSCGLSLGWIAVLALHLSDFVEEGIFGFSYIRYINAALFIAATVIPLFVIYPVTRFGRKVVLIASAIFLFMSFLLCAFAKISLLFFIARALQGIGVGTAFTVLPMYLSEISSNEMRGLCTGSIGFSIQIGVMIITFTNGLFSIKIASLLCLIPLIVFLAIFSWWNPESPVFLAFFGKHQQLEHSLKMLQKDVNKETQNINQYLEDVNHQGGIKNLFKKGFFLVLLLFICQTFTGEPFLSTFITFSLRKFEMPKSNIFFYITIFILIFAPVTALLAIDKLGRKVLLLISTIGSTIVLSIVSICFCLHYSFQCYLPPWIIFVFHILYLFFSHSGLFIVPWVILGEYIAYPQKAVAFALSISCHFASNFLFSFLFNYLIRNMREDLVTGIFAVTNLATVVFVFLLIPETKKKSFHEIQRLLHRNV